MRVTPLARSVGLVHDQQWLVFLKKQEALQTCLRALADVSHTPHEWRALGVHPVPIAPTPASTQFHSATDILFPFQPPPPQVPCSFDGQRRSAASVITNQYVTLQRLLQAVPGLSSVLEVTCDV